MSDVHGLPTDTIRLISSSQIITSVSSVVKELIENSLDAGAKSIQISIENYGLDFIEVKDDGPGVAFNNAVKMFLPGYTSKIRDFNDLGFLQSYGFRGEGLSAICKLGETTLTSKTEKDAFAMMYTITSDGNVVDPRPSHIPKGTIISVKNLFGNLPVRKQYVSSKKKLLEELKKVENVVYSLSVVHPQLRIVLRHNKCNIWQKNSVSSLKQSYMQVVGLRVAAKMDAIQETLGDIALEMVIPKKNSKEIDGIFTSSANHVFIYINKRPVLYKEICKVIEHHISHHFVNKDVDKKHPVFLAAISCIPCELDVNLEPNKSRVLLRNIDEVISLIHSCLQKYYGNNLDPPIAINQSIDIDEENAAAKRLRLDDSVDGFDQSMGEWSLNIIDDSAVPKKSDMDAKTFRVSPVCSQINKENCVLASNDEISHLNELLSDSGQKMVARIDGQVSRNERFDILNQRSSRFYNDCSEKNGSCYVMHKAPPESREVEVRTLSDYGLGCGVLPDWPTRQQTQPVTTTNSYVSLECRNKVNGGINLDPKPTSSVVSASIAQDGGSEELNFLNETDNVAYDAPTIIEDSVLNVGATSATVCPIESGKSTEERASVLNQVEPDSGKVLETIRGGHEPFSETDWSRGCVRLENGKILKGGAAVVNQEIPKKSRVSECVAQFDLSLQSVSSQMGKKELSGFSKFARIMRPKLIEENPGIMFTEVSSLLAERWRSLGADEKEYYESVAKTVDQERVIYKQQKKSVPQVPQPKKSIKQMFEKVQNKVGIKRPPRKQISFSVTLNSIKELRKKLPIHDESLRLIGQLCDTGDWIYINGNEIGHIRHTGLQEIILYQKMLASHKITCKRVESRELSNKEIFGEDNWRVMLSLSREYDPEIGKEFIASDLICKNGFRVELNDVRGEIVSCIIAEVAADIEGYGLQDLIEILDLYREKSEFAGLASWRSTAVKEYLKKEVKRMISQTPEPPNLVDMTKLLDTWHLCLKHLSPQCLHDRQIFVPFPQLNLNTK